MFRFYLSYLISENFMIIASVERKLQGIRQQDGKRALHAPTEFLQLRRKLKTSLNFWSKLWKLHWYDDVITKTKNLYTQYFTPAKFEVWTNISEDY